MAGNDNLHSAKVAKNDEFYTQWRDIENEINAYFAYNREVFKDKVLLCPCDDSEWSEFQRYFALNFNFFGLKKIICTGYAKGAATKNGWTAKRVLESPLYDPAKEGVCGRLFVMERPAVDDVDGCEFKGYLKGDGDFRSDEVRELFKEADVVVTNPPFSLFRAFMEQVMEFGLDFAVIGNMNAITYKEIFPLIKENKVWLGTTHPKEFVVSQVSENRDNYGENDGRTVAKFGNIMWFTNLDHGMRHEEMMLDTMANMLRFSRKLRKKLTEGYGQEDGHLFYPRYDNYDAIEVPFVECIPGDYDGVMGVPISYLDRHNPDQYEIVRFAGGWSASEDESLRKYPAKQTQVSNGAMSTVGKLNDGTPLIDIGTQQPNSTYYTIGDGHYYARTYGRILIRKKQRQD